MKFKSKLLQKFYTQWSLLKNNKQKHLLIRLAERLNDGTMTTKRLNKFMSYKPKENKHEPTKWQTCLKKAHEQELKCFEYKNKTYYRRELIRKPNIVHCRAFKAQAFAITAWAFATVSHSEKKLLTALALEVQRRLGEFGAQGLANTAWAFAMLKLSTETLAKPLG